MPIEQLRLRNDRRMAMTVLALMLVPSLWYVRTDLALYADNWPKLSERLAVRGVMVATSLVGLVLIASARTREAYSRIVFGIAAIIAVTVVTINALRPRGATLPLRTPLFNIAALYAALPNSLYRQIAPPLVLSGALIALRLFWVNSGADGDMGGDIVIVLVLNALGILIVLRRLALEQEVRNAWSAEHEARLASESTLAELETLRGIIPICSYCKKVRSDVGGWEQIESYVRQHSQAQFSHGICPDCFGDRWPEMPYPT